MSQKNHGSSPKKGRDAKREPTPANPAGTAEGLPLWTWLGRPRAWSAGQVAAIAALVSLAASLLAVLSGPDTVTLFAAKGLAVLAYLLLGFVLSREVVRSFRCE
ncbi:MAG: hypothetical protein HZC54_03420 [Verrucomicrobia bacterium]|nr:hypothetical protein [Verrucomicrobiota bacterium]